MDESLSRLKQKESIEACLLRYPQYTDRLEPLLRTALKVEELKDTESPSAEAMAAGRERFLREAARLRVERAAAQKLAKGPARRRRLMLSVAVATLIAALLALAALAGSGAPDTLRRFYDWWGTLVPQPTMTQPATGTPWPTVTPHEYQTPMATRTLYPAESGTPTFTPTCTPTFTSEEPSHRPILPTHTPMATATHTPEPTDTPVPTATPVPPTDTPVPTVTPVPPTHTPHPTGDHGGGHDGSGGNGSQDGRDGSDGHDGSDGGGGHDGSDGGGGHDDRNHGGGDHHGGGH